MNEIITLLSDTGRRDVFCALRSIGQSEFYQAYATDYRPELKFVLADCWDYKGETLIEYDGVIYRVIRTYLVGQGLEIVVTRASAEEAEMYG